MAGYTREFLIEAFVQRYSCLGEKVAEAQRVLASTHYDKVGKDEFRKAASLDAAEIKKYKLVLDNK